MFCLQNKHWAKHYGSVFFSDDIVCCISGDSDYTEMLLVGKRALHLLKNTKIIEIILQQGIANLKSLEFLTQNKDLPWGGHDSHLKQHPLAVFLFV